MRVRQLNQRRDDRRTVALPVSRMLILHVQFRTASVGGVVWIDAGIPVAG